MSVNRAPVAAIKIGLNCLSEKIYALRIAKLDEFDEIIEDCRASCGIAFNSLNELLLYDEIHANQLSLNLQKVVYKEFIIDIVKPFISSFTKESKSLEVQVDDELIGVIASIDQPKIEQIMHNILIYSLNSIKEQTGRTRAIIQFIKNPSEPNIESARNQPFTKDEYGKFIIQIEDNGNALNQVWY